MKIIGLMVAWAAERWIGPALEQALGMCDEVIVSVGWHMESMRKYEDSTMEVCLSYGDRVTMVPVVRGRNHADTKSATMNGMLARSRHFSPGNCIWLLDVDEFYHMDTIRRMKEAMEESGCTNIMAPTKAFFINMRRYLLSEETRLWRIGCSSDRFTSVNNWTGRFSRPLAWEGDGMYHYTLLKDPYARMDFWRSEYSHSQEHKVRWAREIYLNYDLADEDAWNRKNLEMFGRLSPFGISGWKVREDGRLFTFEGRHPEAIESSGMVDIPDFRKLYSPPKG